MVGLTFDLRNEEPGDQAAIHALTTRAFAPMAFSDGIEPATIDALRAAGDLTISLFATHADLIIGHVAFSPAMIAGRNSGWFALGPIAVEPRLQRKGIGKALVGTGLARLRAHGAAGCVLIGDPRYYGQFGFRGDGRLTYAGLAPALVQWLAFSRQSVPTGALGFAPAFDLEQPPK
jgi:putative acetyltransferase